MLLSMLLEHSARQKIKIKMKTIMESNNFFLYDRIILMAIVEAFIDHHGKKILVDKFILPK